MVGYERYSHLIRQLDINYRPNLIITVLTLLTFIIGLAYNVLDGLGTTDSLAASVTLAVHVFCIWAIGREIDPDHDYVAFPPIALFAVGAAYYELPSAWFILLVLVSMRMASGTTGLPPKTSDSLVAIAVSSIVAYRFDMPLLIFIIGASYLPGSLFRKSKNDIILFSATMAIVAFMSSYFNMVNPVASLSPDENMVIAISSIVYLVFVLDSKRIRSLGDLTQEPLDPTNIMSARAIFLILTLLITFCIGFGPSFAFWSVAIVMAIHGTYVAASRIRREGFNVTWDLVESIERFNSRSRNK